MAEETWKDHKEKKFAKPAPLKDLRVLEVCTLLFGPLGPAFLAQLGAEVIKFEIPPLGDPTRSFGPFGWLYKEHSIAVMHINPNKYWVGLEAASHNWWKFDSAISYTLLPFQAILLSNQCCL